MTATYKEAGVDLEAYQDAMARLPRLMHRTFSPRVVRLDGGFAGLFQLDFGNPLFDRNYRNPVLVSCTDGVGTKLKVAQMTDTHHTVGIDLVAMCVNDAICCGAEPLFFNDYIAMSHDDPPLIEKLVEGISAGCVQADCALNAGETAIMPDLYSPGDYDLAGFHVGVVERKRVIDGAAISPGDVVLGLASTGLHSNGFSLVRRVVFEMAGLSVDDRIEELDQTVGETLLTPTRIYVPAMRRIQQHYRVKNVLHGVAHITGGGLCENLQRIMPSNTKAVLERGSWEVPAVFPWLQGLGQIADEEMDRVFNMGIGLAVIVSSYYAESVGRIVSDAGIPYWKIGHVEANSGPGEVIWG